MSENHERRKGWRNIELRHSNISIIDGDRGVNYPTQSEFAPAGFCLFLNTGNIKDDAFDFTDCAFISETKDALLRKGRISRGDIVLTTRGTVGSVAFYHEGIPFDVIRINSGMVVLRCHEGLVARYVYQLFKSGVMKSQMALYSSGSAQPQLPIKDLRRIQLPTPPPETQRKIAAVLAAYDDLIEANRRRITLLERMAEEIYREWFVRLRFPGHATTKITKGIPSGWSVRKIGDIVAEVKRSIRQRDLTAEQRYIGLEHIPRRSIALREWGTADSVDSDKLRFEERDVLFSKIRPYLHKVSLAHFSGVCSTDTIVLRPVERAYEGYVLFTVFSETFIELATVASNGTKMPRADWKFLKKLELAIPSRELCAQFQTHFDAQFSQIVGLLRANEVLQHTRDLLLPRLISGKLPVEDLPIAFPPSMAEAIAH